MLPLADMTPVIAVRQGQSRKASTRSTTADGDVRVAQANPDAAAVGKLTRDALPAGQWEQLKKARTVFKLTVNDVANDITVGAVDAGIVWDATVNQYPGLEAVASPRAEQEEGPRLPSPCSRRHSSRPPPCVSPATWPRGTRGWRTSSDRAFEPVEGDVWAETPELRLFAGAMLRPAIEETIQAFEKREGVKVTRVYNGCGILVGQMRDRQQTARRLFRLRQSFMNQVHDLFLDADRHLQQQPGHRRAEGQPAPDQDAWRTSANRACASASATKSSVPWARSRSRPSSRASCARRSMKNVKVAAPDRRHARQPTAHRLARRRDRLHQQRRQPDDIEVYAVKDIPCAVAVQPWAVGKESQHKQLAGRLLAAIRSQGLRDRFEEKGFGWKDGK